MSYFQLRSNEDDIFCILADGDEDELWIYSELCLVKAKEPDIEFDLGCIMLSTTEIGLETELYKNENLTLGEIFQLNKIDFVVSWVSEVGNEVDIDNILDVKSCEIVFN